MVKRQIREITIVNESKITRKNSENTAKKCSNSVTIRELLNESMKITLIHYLMVTKINHRIVSFHTIYYLAFWSSLENTKYVSFRYDHYTVYNHGYYLANIHRDRRQYWLLLSNSCKTRRNTAKDEQKYQPIFCSSFQGHV